MNKKRIGSHFDDFLREEGIFEQAEATAIKRVIAFQIEKEMSSRNLTKTEMAKRMKTSRAAFERLIDPTNTSVTLQTLGKAASALGKTLRVEIA